MKDEKQLLLEELEKLGVHKTGRKVRSDKGQDREPYNTSNLPRIDKGLKRDKYAKFSDWHRKVFQQFLEAHTDPEGYGDNLTRDSNGIFPPRITSYYKTIKSRTGIVYSSSVKRRRHPEQLRWNWWMAAYAEKPEEWLKKICDWYFIEEKDIALWTYNEWAWSYVKTIDGVFSRGKDSPKLSYEDFLNGKYGWPEYDAKGNILWAK